MKTSSFIDWMSYVVENRVAETLADFVHWFKVLGLSDLGIKRCKARNAYKLAYTNQLGAIIMSSPSRPDMGINILLTGSVLARYSWLACLRNLNAIPGHFTRIDLTIDAHDSGLDTGHLYELADTGQMRCRAQNVSRVQSKTGTTCYVGSRSSERFMRIYDKAGEQGIEGEDWKRIELEASGQKAAWIGAYLAQADTDAIAPLIKDFIDFPDYDAWNAIFGTVVAKTTESDKRVTDTEKWLLQMIAPTLAKQIYYDASFRKAFSQRVLACYRELTETKLPTKLGL